ncbi:hypothetical protein LCGC14_1096510 [marine sediment metagenome]|uniref:Uncharacterized protein n=1 Tax=marine sediment metagenome TaxID=412755 RepID=A0A0F9MF59_9ZZZZ
MNDKIKKKDAFYNDVYFKNDKQINIAKKYNYTTGYVSQIAKKFKLLKFPPKTKDNVLICIKCDTTQNLVFHHDHETGEYIALVCQPCNLKFRDNELDFKEPSKFIAFRCPTKLYEEVLEEEENMSRFIKDAIISHKDKKYNEDLLNAFTQYSKLFHLIEMHFINNRNTLNQNELIIFVKATITNAKTIDNIEESIK